MTLLVFSDLDGTLLDHATYSYAPALPAIAALRQAGGRLILATSKTAMEVAELHAELDLGDTPAIVENGAGIYRPEDGPEGNAEAYARIRQALRDVPPHLRGAFEGFADMGPERIAEVTGLPLEAAERAAKRCHSEPGLWTGREDKQQAFKAILGTYGVTARSGGRFFTLSLGRTKADAMREVMVELGATHTIALGDAPNDLEMIQTADHGVIVRNDHGPGIPHLPGEDDGTIRRTQAPGPEGWAEAVLALLNDLNKDDPNG